MRSHALLAICSLFLSTTTATPYVDYNNLPNETIFPGPWEDYIKAPANKSYIRPARIWKAKGNVTDSGFEAGLRAADHDSGSSILIGIGGILTLEFDENIAGRVCFDVESVGDDPTVNLGYSESSFFAAPVPDATTDRKERDLPLAFPLGNGTGPICVEKEFIRGGFKYLTIQLPYSFRYEESKSRIWDALDGLANAGQRVLGLEPKPLSSVLRPDSAPYRRPFVALRNIWVNCTAFPSQVNGRAYSGYFASSSSLLNRIWYAGAWTLQLSTIDPAEGSALIDYNRVVDGNKSPEGSWYSNFTISNGSAVTTDGAKRDRVVWPGDMYIAVPGIAVSTYDMLAVRNALDVLFDHQYADGGLPYAGPPLGFRGEFSDTYHLHTLLGAFNYVLYSGDVAWLESRWPAYLRALEVSMGKVDELGLLHVSSTADWLRPGMTGHNLEASAMLFEVLRRTFQLVEFLGSDWAAAATTKKKSWEATQRALERGLARLYCADSGLYADNVGRRGCAGPERCEAQDGNSWALISRMALVLHGDGAGNKPTARNVSENLRARWTKYGAPAVEFPNVISPFASGFELLAHCGAGNVDAAVELMLLEWGYLMDGPGFTNSTLAEGFRIDGYVQYPAYWGAARNSHAHGWASGPTGVLMTEVLGIELQGPAGLQFVIHPELTRWLGWVSGGFATTKGKFEVTMSKAMEVNQEGSAGAKGQLVVVTTPPGTSGAVKLGHGGFEHKVDMRSVERTKAWFVKDEGATVLSLSDDTTSMLVAGNRLQSFKDQSIWAQLPESPSRQGWRLKYDDSFKPPEMEDRPVGVVDWEALDQNYAPSLWDMEWKIQDSEE